MTPIPTRWPVGLLALLTACLERPSARPLERLNASFTSEVANDGVDSVDLLFVVDNSNSMSAYQQRLGAQFRVLIDELVDPPEAPGAGRPMHPPARSLHVAVVSSDLGTPGANLGSCTVSPDVGDDGLLNPIRIGRSPLRPHRPLAGGALPPAPTAHGPRGAVAGGEREGVVRRARDAARGPALRTLPRPERVNGPSAA